MSRKVDNRILVIINDLSPSPGCVYDDNERFLCIMSSFHEGNRKRARKRQLTVIKMGWTSLQGKERDPQLYHV